MENSFQPAHYEWSTGDSGPVFRIEKTGTYAVLARNHCGWSRDRIRVEFRPCDELFFSNVFSPNGDGVNDRWYPFNRGDVRRIKYLQIFSRWGELVFERTSFPPNHVAFGWDGTYKNRPLPPGLFIWKAEFIDSRGKTSVQSGALQLLR